jgi:hypothetical protein
MEPRPLDLTYEIVPVRALDAAARDALWEVYRRHFDAPRSALDASLAQADQVILYKHRPTGALRGLVAMALREREHRGRRFFWMWAGALAVDRECRGKWVLERSWVDVFARFRLRHPVAPLYWIYASLSFQSFRMMARNFATHWPHPTRATPPWEASLIDTLARELYPTRWDATRRVVRAVRGKTVRAESSRTSRPEADPLRAFYRSVNPGVEQGEIVVLLAPIDWPNAATVVRRLGAGLLHELRGSYARRARHRAAASTPRDPSPAA